MKVRRPQQAEERNCCCYRGPVGMLVDVVQLMLTACPK